MNCHLNGDPLKGLMIAEHKQKHNSVNLHLSKDFHFSNTSTHDTHNETDLIQVYQMQRIGLHRSFPILMYKFLTNFAYKPESKAENIDQ